MAKAVHIYKVPPRMLGLPDAAAYCGISGPHFKAHCPVRPLRLGDRVLWDRVQIDRWLDALSAPCSIVSGDDHLERLDRVHAH